MRQEHLSSILVLAEQLALAAGRTVVAMREQQLQRDFKGENAELVTNADLAADHLICQGIRQAFPEHQILAEESNPHWHSIQAGAQPFWIIDPIDGTVNYAHGHQQSAISIAYCEGDEPLVGVVHNPFTLETFTAVKNGGAFLNGQPIVPSHEVRLDRALVGTGFPYDRNKRAELMPKIQAILEHCADIRRLGAAALDICWVACGRLDAYWETLSIWDFAAAQIVAKEAGAVFGHLYDVPDDVPEAYWNQNIIVANVDLYPSFKSILLEADNP